MSKFGFHFVAEIGRRDVTQLDGSEKGSGDNRFYGVAL
jgi:hypothetical protein